MYIRYNEMRLLYINVIVQDLLNANCSIFQSHSSWLVFLLSVIYQSLKQKSIMKNRGILMALRICIGSFYIAAYQMQGPSNK